MTVHNLSDKFSRISEPPVPEEILGAYLEGKLSHTEQLKVDMALSADETLAELLQADIQESYLYEEMLNDGDIIPDYDADTLSLPEIELEPYMPELAGDCPFEYLPETAYAASSDDEIPTYTDDSGLHPDDAALPYDDIINDINDIGAGTDIPLFEN